MNRTVLSLLLLLLSAFPVAGQAGYVQVRGKEFVTPTGQPLLLRGINLGNWLLPEGYMFKFEAANSPRLIETVINQLLGPEEARKFWRTYRAQYIHHAR
jgi:endoglucanase